MKYDKTSPLSIFDYSKQLIGKSLREVVANDLLHTRSGKGGLGQLVEELFFEYGVNNDQRADFEEAKLELKCTPLKVLNNGSLAIKERLVCTMIDFFEVADTPFKESKLYHKCFLMLILFYLHNSSLEQHDLNFLFSVLWQLPEKDLIIIENDYNIISRKIRDGKAHLLSEGDTMYLGACRKGQKGDKAVPQPNSEELAPKRAFSLKTSYMRTILPHVIDTAEGYYCNYAAPSTDTSLTTIDELKENSFKEILSQRFATYMGLDYNEICDTLGLTPSLAKSKYYGIASAMAGGSLNEAEEIKKSGMIIKTIRVNYNGRINEHMSFKNLDYKELLENDNWYDSELYELFSGNFMFVIFKEPEKNSQITIKGRTETKYCFDRIVFWTMPQADLEKAESYWMQIKTLVAENRIPDLRKECSIANSDIFHVRPKGRDGDDLDINPLDGTNVEKNCYWFNNTYVRKIIEP